MVAHTRSAHPTADHLHVTPRVARRAFTLMELMTVVVILGILVAIITFSVIWAIKAAERAAFAENLRNFTNAAHMYHTEYGYYPPDAEPGELPDGFAKYIDPEKWSNDAPFGGKWDITSGGGPNGTQFGIGVAMGGGMVDEEDNVVREQVTSMANVDSEIDDGDVSTGNFRMLTPGSFYLVIAE